jgi:hypothetical protein
VPARQTPLVDRLKAPLRQPFRRYRLATRKARILPAFLIIGAQRAGTTTFFDALRRHPDIAPPRSVDRAVAWDKELHFFDEKFEKGLDWYRSFFPLKALRDVRRALGRDLIAGESTPYYLFHPAVPERVASAIPDMRLVVILRDPVERAYSHYQLMRRMGRERLSFEDALDAEEERLAGERERLLVDPSFRARHHRNHSYVSRGLYAEQLERWLTYFPREQLLVLDVEEFFAHRAEMYALVLDFLAVRQRDLASLKARATTASPGRPWSRRETRNRARYEPLDPAVRARLEKRFAEPNARLFALLGREFNWSSSAEAGADRAAFLGGQHEG